PRAEAQDCAAGLLCDCSGETIAASSNSTLSAPPAPFLGSLAPGVVNQDLAHRLGGDSEEVGAVLPAWTGLIGQPQISLVDQRSRLERVVGTLSAHMTVSDAPELLIDQRGQLDESGTVSVTPVHQELGHSMRRDRNLTHKLFSVAYHSHKFSAPRSFSKKTFDSDDHFDRSFSCMVVKGKPQRQREQEI